MRESPLPIVPRWATGLVAKLVRDAPPVVSAALVAQYLAELGEEAIDARAAVLRLLKYGWLRKTKIRGAYAFIQPGTDVVVDPYIDLRGWYMTHPLASICLAGVSAAWHLGYLAREPDRPAVWLDSTIVLPKKLRATLDIVTTNFPSPVDLRRLGPSSRLLRRRRLDLLDWSKGMPAFGPEALLVQIAARPASFTAWVDIGGCLPEFAADIDIERLTALLPASSAATRQRVVYLLKLGGRRDVMGLLPQQPLLPVKFGHGGPASWDADTRVIDNLIYGLIKANSKG